MKSKMHLVLRRVKIYILLSIVSILLGVIIKHSTSDCGSIISGFPFKFIRSSCSCDSHQLLDLKKLLFNLLYHSIIWSVLLYLWSDAKESWSILKKQSRSLFQRL